MAFGINTIRNIFSQPGGGGGGGGGGGAGSGSSSSSGSQYYGPAYGPGFATNTNQVVSPSGAPYYGPGYGPTYVPPTSQSAPPNPYNQPQQQSGGGGSSSGSSRSTTRYNPAAVWDPSSGKTFQSAFQEGFIDEFGNPIERDREAEYRNQINSVFDEVNNLLGTQEANWKAGYPEMLKNATAPFEALYAPLQSGLDSAMQMFGVQRNQTREREEVSKADARRQYDELSQANRQRFGGSSSAGGFADVILGREAQRNFGNISRTTQQSFDTIGQSEAGAQQAFVQEKANLDRQKAQAYNQAEQLYQSRLNEIANSRVANAQNKAAAQLQALAELRENVRNIENSARQMAMNLYAQAQQMAMTAGNSINSFRQAAGTPANLPEMSQMSYSQAGGGFSPALSGAAMGQLSGRLRFDPLTGQYVAA